MGKVSVRFLGTNGWYSTETGKTICILVDTPRAQILLDAGEGFHRFREYANPAKPTYLFISHTHLDHIYGLHMMGMLGKLEAGGVPQDVKTKSLFIGCPPGFRETIEKTFNRPYTASYKEMDFPVEIEELPELKKRDFGSFTITPFLLDHAIPNAGYRIEAEGKTLFYSGDTAACEKTVQGAEKADLLIHECSFRPGITSSWGHANPEQAAGIARQARVKQLALVHFDAYHYTTMGMRKEAEEVAKRIFPQTIAAADGLVLTL